MKRWKSLTAALCAAVLLCGFSAVSYTHLDVYKRQMYEKDGLPLEKVVRNIIRARFLRPGVRPYRTENIYAPFTHRGAAGKEDAIAESKKSKARPRKGR